MSNELVRYTTGEDRHEISYEEFVALLNGSQSVESLRLTALELVANQRKIWEAYTDLWEAVRAMTDAGVAPGPVNQPNVPPIKLQLVLPTDPLKITLALPDTLKISSQSAGVTLEYGENGQVTGTRPKSPAPAPAAPRRKAIGFAARSDKGVA